MTSSGGGGEGPDQRVVPGWTKAHLRPRLPAAAVRARLRRLREDAILLHETRTGMAWKDGTARAIGGAVNHRTNADATRPRRRRGTDTEGDRQAAGRPNPFHL